MAIRQILVDDLTGKEGDDIETITFAYKGINYEIDLGDESEKDLASALDPYIKAARRVQSRPASAGRSSSTGLNRAPSGSGLSPEELAMLRDWANYSEKGTEAREKYIGGREVAERGRIKVEIRDLWIELGKPSLTGTEIKRRDEADKES